MAAKHRATTAPGPGDGLVRAGAVVFVVGVLAVLADLVPFFLGHPNRPLLVNVAAFLAPVGLGMALLGLARCGRVRLFNAAMLSLRAYQLPGSARGLNIGECRGPAATSARAAPAAPARGRLPEPAPVAARRAPSAPTPAAPSPTPPGPGTPPRSPTAADWGGRGRTAPGRPAPLPRRPRTRQHRPGPGRHLVRVRSSRGAWRP